MSNLLFVDTTASSCPIIRGGLAVVRRKVGRHPPCVCCRFLLVQTPPPEIYPADFFYILGFSLSDYSSVPTRNPPHPGKARGRPTQFDLTTGKLTVCFLLNTPLGLIRRQLLCPVSRFECFGDERHLLTLQCSRLRHLGLLHQPRKNRTARFDSLNTVSSATVRHDDDR